MIMQRHLSRQEIRQRKRIAQRWQQDLHMKNRNIVRADMKPRDIYQQNSTTNSR